MTDSSAIALAPIIQILAPLVSTVVIALIGVLASWIAPTIYRWFHIKIDQSQIDDIKSKAQTIAGQMIAESAINLASVSVTAGNPQIVKAANSIVAKLPAAMVLSGWDVDRVSKLIVGEIGKLTAPASSVSGGITLAPPADSLTQVVGNVAEVKAPAPVAQTA